jgi:Lon protease-like protein
VPNLRLFLLNTVLFPGQSLQLVVFEPRYHQLVSECLATGEPFGVALIRSGPEVGGPAVPYSVGTTARIERATPLPDGRTALEVQGERRFIITRVESDHAYPSAMAEYLPPGDSGAPPPSAALARATALFREALRLRAVATAQYERTLEVPDDAATLADAIGALGLGAPPDRQRVLEADDASVRLQRAIDHLEGALPNVRGQALRAVTDRMGGPRLN